MRATLKSSLATPSRIRANTCLALAAMVARRLLIVLAVLLALTALAAGLAPRSGLDRDTPPPVTAAPTPAPAKGVVQKTLDAQATGQRVEARVGQTVMLTIKSDTLETVTLDQYGDKTAEPDSPAQFELLADTAGTYPITLQDSGLQIGELDIAENG